MNTLAICIGILFFLNPTVGIIDIFPDFIGALLLLWGLRRVLFLSEKIENAVPKLWGLFAVSVVKTVLMLFTAGMGGSTQVLLSFAFSVGEGLLLCNILSPLADGLDLMKIRYGTRFTEEKVPSPRNTKGLSAEEKKELKALKKRIKKETKYDISKFRVPVISYTVFRLVMCFLPEATELRISKPSTEEMGVAALSEFKGLLYGVIIPVVCFFMIFAVIRTVKTFKGYGADKGMLEAFDEAFEKDKREYPTRHKRKLIKTAYIMFMLSVASSAYFFADNKDILPKIMAASAFAVLIGYFGRGFREKIAGFVLCGALGATSLLYYSFADNYFSEYLESNAEWLEGAAALYRPLCIVMAVQAVLLFVLMIYSSVFLRRCSIEIFESMDDTETTEKKIKNFKLQMTVFRFVALVFCIAAALYAPLRPTYPMILTILIGLDAALILSAYFVDMKL